MAQITTKSQISYRCDTCNRSIKLPLNRSGMDTLQQCTITEKCVGTLYPILAIQDTDTALPIPPSVPGLDNWEPRKVFFKYERTIPSNVWTIQHNLGTKPIVDVWIKRQLLEGQVITTRLLPTQFEVQVIDRNVITITFDNAQIGIADLISTASGINPPYVPIIDVPTTQQVSTAQQFVIATTSNAPLIDFEITYYSKGNVVRVPYGNVGRPSIASPWAGVQTVYVNGKTLTVRGFDFRLDPYAPSFFLTNQIIDGSSLYFSSFSRQPDENVILLSKPPYTSSTDRLVTQYVDTAAINTQTPQLLYSNGEIVAQLQVIKTIYPPIQIVD